MKHLCLVYRLEGELEATAKRQHDAIADGPRELQEEPNSSGRCLASDALEPSRMATTIRVRTGVLSIADGPFEGMKEQLGGFCLPD